MAILIMDRLKAASDVFYNFLYNMSNIKFDKWEIFLNILFIIIVIIFSLIIYWDTINRKVARTSRCKRQLDIYNKNKGTYVIRATDNSRNTLYNVIYDTNQRNVNVECACNAGNYVNHFNDIKVKNMKLNKDETINKVCSCDQYYNIDNVLYEGDQGLTRYMLGKESGFFDDLQMMQ